MNQLISDKNSEIKDICEKHSVASLFIYGSALKESFSSTSDLDFAVEFKDTLTPLEIGEAFFNLLNDLEQLFNRKIDLLSYRVVKNPIFKAELDKTKKTLYAAA
jgi:predicted nucleotidyltransferase